MKWFVLIAAIALFASVKADQIEDEDGEARLGFVSVASNGDTTLTFNATSIQNAVILGLFILVLGGLLLPLLGVFGEDTTGFGYGYEQSGGYQTGYEAPSSGYSNFAKRSVQMMGPVMEALAAGHKKYEEED